MLMQLLQGHQSDSFSKQSVATVGNFDGVHSGHQALLKHLKSEAVSRCLPLRVYLFEPQPGEYFLGDAAPPRLSSLREKHIALQEAGVDEVVCLRFNAKMAKMSAEDFAQCYFFSAGVVYLLIGEDFRFGRDRLGGFELLKKMAKNLNFQVGTFPVFQKNGQRVSSTSVREVLLSGRLNEARILLGRHYQICGRVVKGQGLGRQWEIPTANIALPALRRPLQGVFCVLVQRPNGVCLQGVANFGSRPTVDGLKTVLEVHLLHFDENIYGERLSVRFLHKLRDEMRFDSMAALIKQIQTDIAVAKNHFSLFENTLIPTE